VKIIAFGTHLSLFHGYTIKQIEEAGFDVAYKIESMLLTDSPASISTSIGLTAIKFSDFWMNHKNDFDLVFCLGDRYEMFGAVMAGVPFQIKFAHLHGGETTLGAIDNVYRHSITLASKYHFVSTLAYAHRVSRIIDSDSNIFHVGALSLDNLFDLKLLSIEQFKQKWGIDISKKTILVTFNPETVDYNNNEKHINELVKTVNSLTSYQILITMPNADTAGNYVRQVLIQAYSKVDHVFLVENLGSLSYFTAMKYCSFLLGNTSSGIIEAASLKKYVINIGDRQKGRLSGDNVINVPIDKDSIVNAVGKIENEDLLINENIYYNGGASEKIIDILKTIDSKNE
jgi:GDP/UDP-N,N'-diacetylbacillosamine 2-epimerase (hydrolysing)